MKMNWNKLRHRGKATEPARDAKPDNKGAQTHIKRMPCKVLSAAERQEWLRGLGL